MKPFDEMIEWVQAHPVATVIAGLVGIGSGVWSNTFPEYTNWQALGTGVGMFGLSMWIAKEFIEKTTKKG
jgi:hypothetical protein